MAVISISLSDEVFGTWRMQKYLTEDLSITLIIGVLSAFIGIMITSASAARGGSTTLRITAKQAMYLRRAYKILFFLTITGYAIWIASAAAQGVRPQDLIAVVDRQLGAISELKSNSRPIGGLTTLTQFAPVVVVIGHLLRKIGIGGRAFYLLVFLAAVRTVFYAERLALIEVLIPLLVVAALTASAGRKWSGLARTAPLIVAPMIWAVFAISEYTRSWVYYQMTTNMPFTEWVSARLAGYYVTSFNNSAMFVQAHDGTNATPYFSVPFIWNAPGVDTAAQGGVQGFMPDEWWTYILNTRGSKDFTNVGSFLVTYGEFGMVGMIAFWLAVGLLIGLVFSRLTNGSVPGVIAYASIFVGILELPRFIYWTQGRATPILVAIVVIALSYPATKARLKAAALPSWASTDSGRRIIGDQAQSNQSSPRRG
ncbi:O-antigen polymerase [Paenarthrobacter nicotinovorans]|uniref:O-antigen polymerase n=1 Tax=Paenarthrobacter nicotinovorans TaxID=29320 RepID=UPI0039A77CD7